MASTSAFAATGPTFVFAATTSAGTALQLLPSSGPTANYDNVRVVNSGTTIAWVTLSATQAGAAQTIPVAGTPGNAVAILPGTVECFTLPGGQPWVNAQSVTSPATLYLTLGEGL